MDKIFTVSPSRKDKDAVLFKALAGEHSDLLRAINSNTVTGYVVDAGSYIRVAKHASDAVARHCISRGWSQGV